MALSSYHSNYARQLDFSTFNEENPFDFTNYDNLFFDPIDTYLNDPIDYSLPQQNYNQVVQNPLFHESLITLEDHELSNRFLKRRKCYYEDDNDSNGQMGNYDYMKTPSLLHCDDLNKQPQVVVPPLSSTFTPPQYFQESSFSCLTYCDNTNTTTKGCNRKDISRESSVTAQSIAARMRRKKISDKTVELSKLIPGGGSNKMNSTAEMFHVAFKYVKFMQAQLGILQSMSSLQVHDIIGQNHLEELVTSGKFQDKLSSIEKCLVPIEFVKEIVKDVSFRSSVSDTALKQLLVLD